MASLEYTFTFGPRDLVCWGWAALKAGEFKTAGACFYLAAECWLKP